MQLLVKMARWSSHNLQRLFQNLVWSMYGLVLLFWSKRHNNPRLRRMYLTWYGVLLLHRILLNVSWHIHHLMISHFQSDNRSGYHRIVANWNLLLMRQWYNKQPHRILNEASWLLPQQHLMNGMFLLLSIQLLLRQGPHLRLSIL